MSRDRIKVKGRGHEGGGDMDIDEREDGRGGVFESIPQTGKGTGPAMCKPMVQNILYILHDKIYRFTQ